MKKLLGIVVLGLLLSSNAYADHKGWPHGKKWAYNCAKTTDCNIKIENIKEQPKLFIGKSVFNGKNSVKNIAYKGKTIKPNKMLGVWGEGWKSSDEYIAVNGQQQISRSLWCKGISCLNLQWNETLDSMIYAPAINDGNEIFLNEQFKKEITGAGGDSERFFKPWRHALIISHLLQLGNLENLKQGLINGAKGKWLNELQPDTFLYQSGDVIDYQAYGNSLNWFYPTIITLLEAHIVLQQNSIYTEEEFKMVHSWLKKRVWALEQGPMDGLVSSGWRWKNFFEPGNHETINKKVAYMLWGVADQNEIYFTAAINGFEDFYKTMRKKNGTFKNEHKEGDGGNYGIASGNYVGQCMVIMAVILHHQGIDVRKKYPKIEKFVQWASKNYKNPQDIKYGGQNNNLRFLEENPLKSNTVGWMHLWDKEFRTNYAEEYNFNLAAKEMIVYGVADASNIITP